MAVATGPTPGMEPQDAGGLGERVVGVDPLLHLCDPSIEQPLQVRVDIVEKLGRAELLMRLDLDQQSLAHSDELRAL